MLRVPSCGFALGWAMLAILSVRFTDQPQQWAAAPAVFMGVGGLLLVLLGSPVDGVLTWIWPQKMLDRKPGRAFCPNCY